ncbi:AzlD domain-containing protein [Streptomyces sp. MNU76]|uniref:AzlD domain-containing protein n=1 Tax=unclassified Streptomyces TaxID=2593676 RepID=UPI001E5BBC3E|nr:AzlD domain-containing protein [Streptomyces sp. MNU76]MCC9707702.1 AzlD domain-containing protein [Streptomyces sp. MNU76]WRZ47569.1 AzlD domain-containing protein [Streptomyces sp. NBC_01314]
MTTVTIVLMGAVTFALRFCFFGPLKPEQLPGGIERALPYVMPAVLMAIIVPSVILAPSPDDGPGWLSPYLVGALVGFGVGVFKKDNFFLVFASAVAAFALAKFLL